MGLRRLLELSSFQAFRAPGFGALWTGALISNIGTLMAMVAAGVWVTEQTGKAAWTGTVAALTFLPAVVLSPVAGALADRFERRRYLALLTGAQIAVAACLALLAFTGHLTVGWMALLAFLGGCASTFSVPGFVALISELVPPAALPSAFSLNSAQYNVGRVLGPALATIVFAVAGPAWAFAVNALSFTAVFWALSRIPRSIHKRQSPPPLWHGIRDGFAVARGDPGIRLALMAVLAISVLVAPFIGLVPVFALRVFQRGAETASLFTTAHGLGAIAGAFALAPLVRRFGLRRVAMASSLVLGPSAAAFWLAPSPEMAAAFIPLLGAAYLASLTTLNTIGQLRAPPEAQARVSSIHSMLLGGGYAVGVVVMGALADVFGLRLVLTSAAAAFLCLCLIGRSTATRGLRALEPHVAPSAARAWNRESPEEGVVLAEPGEPDLSDAAESAPPGAPTRAEERQRQRGGELG
ncbi:MAG TPA: MFS transporter [Myxococcaceae bacterium]|nr:MFS transporter [Myxococcaceae bacterium]